MKKSANIFIIALLGGLFALGINKAIEKNINKKTEEINSVIPIHTIRYNSQNTTSIDFTEAASASIQSVVHIKTTYQQKNNYYDDFFGSTNPFRDFFQNDPNFRFGNTQPLEAFGSGVIISEDGYIVTNNHVVQDGENIQVTLNDKRVFNAKIIGTDPSTDIALIKIDEKDLPFILFGNSDSLKVGEWVLAVGNPFNLTSTVTAGIISAKGRNLNILNGKTAIESYIQTDAAVNMGNSGGALVNINGQLIGINTAIASPTGTYDGYSFAIPVSIVRKVVNDIIEFGEVQRAFLGVNAQEVDSKVAKENNLDKIQGVIVTSVLEGSAAIDAGIKEGDVIIKIEGTLINSNSELKEQIAKYRPGDKISITYLRNGKENTVTAELKNIKGTTGIIKSDIENVVTLLGATFEPLDKEELQSYGLSNGLKITNLQQGKLKSAGIKEGFIITSIDKKPIYTTEDVQTILQNKHGGILIEGIYPNGMRAYYGFGM
jgi:serine protease Do